MTEREAIEALQAENARLVALLESHGIAWHAPPAAASPAAHIASVRARAGASVSRAQPVHCREGGFVSPAVPGSHRCLPGSLG
jgi:hypothetical protein